MIEEVQQQGSELLLELGGAPRAAIADGARELSFGETGDVGADPRVLGAALRARDSKSIAKVIGAG